MKDELLPLPSTSNTVPALQYRERGGKILNVMNIEKALSVPTASLIIDRRFAGKEKMATKKKESNRVSGPYLTPPRRH
jgi:hypothetical protein